MIRSSSGGINIRATILSVALVGSFSYPVAISAAADASDSLASQSAGSHVVDVQEPMPDARKEIICERESRLPSRIIRQRCYVKYHGKDGSEWVDDGLSLLTRDELERFSEMQEQYEEQQREMQRRREEMLCRQFGQC